MRLEPKPPKPPSLLKNGGPVPKQAGNPEDLILCRVHRDTVVSKKQIAELVEKCTKLEYRNEGSKLYCEIMIDGEVIKKAILERLGNKKPGFGPAVVRGGMFYTL